MLPFRRRFAFGFRRTVSSRPSCTIPRQDFSLDKLTPTKYLSGRNIEIRGSERELRLAFSLSSLALSSQARRQFAIRRVLEASRDLDSEL